jgi:hypothetical protein
MAFTQLGIGKSLADLPDAKPEPKTLHWYNTWWWWVVSIIVGGGGGLFVAWHYIASSFRG